jgi:uncharacterized protein (DUF1778 family)
MNKKKKNIILRVTEEEKNKIVQYAKSCRLSTSEFIRKSVLSKAPTFLSADDRKEISELKSKLIDLIRIGNLYHEQRTLNKSIIGKVKSFIKRIS